MDFYSHSVLPGIDTMDNWLSIFGGIKDKARRDEAISGLIPHDLVSELRQGLGSWKNSNGQYEYGRQWRETLGIEVDKDLVVASAITESLTRK